MQENFYVEFKICTQKTNKARTYFVIPWKQLYVTYFFFNTCLCISEGMFFPIVHWQEQRGMFNLREIVLSAQPLFLQIPKAEISVWVTFE